MSAEHKRPLLAFVAVAVLCALFLGHAVRSEAIVGILRAIPAPQVQRQIAEPPMDQPRPGPGEQAAQPAAPALPSQSDTTTSQPSSPKASVGAKATATREAGRTKKSTTPRIKIRGVNTPATEKPTSPVQAPPATTPPVATPPAGTPGVKPPTSTPPSKGTPGRRPPVRIPPVRIPPVKVPPARPTPQPPVAQPPSHQPPSQHGWGQSRTAQAAQKVLEALTRGLDRGSEGQRGAGSWQGRGESGREAHSERSRGWGHGDRDERGDWDDRGDWNERGRDRDGWGHDGDRRGDSSAHRGSRGRR